MAINLPTTKIAAEKSDPKNLLIFSKPKQGKSSALAELPGALCIDLEDGGYDYIDAVKVKANSVSDIKEICKAIKEANYPYQFIVLDTITALEEMVKPMALKMYLETPAGSKFTGKNILDAPMGAGYSKVREAMELVIDFVSKCAPNIILVCHTKDSAVGDSDLNVKSIDLAGKTGRILSSKSDAIGFLYRDDDSNTVLSFNTNDKFVECGARPSHLRNKDVILGEMQENGEIIYHWERIFPSLQK
jgi:hypothetical protein